MYYDYIKSDICNYTDKYENADIGKIIKYSLVGGKCIRGFIVKHVMNTLSDNKINFWEPIASVEVLHAASLIIDDLPCMDNSFTRRNNKSTFVKFGERQAILSALFMTSDAFKILLDPFKHIRHHLSGDDQYDLVHKLVTEWSELVGKNLIIGQMLDLQEDIQKVLNIPFQTDKLMIMVYKTSSIFMMAFILGAVYSCKKDLDYEAYKNMGLNLGILFQIMDDFCDLEEDGDNTNFVKTNGITNSLVTYITKKKALVLLLRDQNLYTDEMTGLIRVIDDKLVTKVNTLIPITHTINKQACISLLRVINKF